MNNEEIINSGILMDYCLGILSEDEKNKIEKLCIDYPEIAHEVDLLQNGLHGYTFEKTNWKREQLKKSIWETIKKDEL